MPFIPGSRVRGIDYDAGSLWIVYDENTQGDYSSIARLDAVTGATLASSGVFNWNARDIVHAGGFLWVTDALSDVVRKVDPATFAPLGSFPSGGGEPCGIAFDGTNLWLDDPNAMRTWKLDMSGAQLGSFVIPAAYREGLEVHVDRLWTHTDVNEFSDFGFDGSFGASHTITSMAYVRDIAFGGGQAFIVGMDDKVHVFAVSGL